MALTIQEILKKDITRSIDGVIKASDESHLLQEVEEFVITKEIYRELKRFVESYSESIENSNNFPYNGVWISGYFGSGKSHLLKILSLLLADRYIDEVRLRDVFLAKIDEPLFRADFERIFAVPATSILFNIEQMAEGSGEQAVDPVLYAFNRMFNKMRGYYDESGPIANFERDLDEEGKLQAFSQFYREKNGIDWNVDRPKALFLGRTRFIETLAAFRHESPQSIDQTIQNYENHYTLTVDGFTKEVAKWLQRQPTKRHRINFFVDEIGQFIAGKTQAMLSLQTIVESLGVETGERAWVFVTSQEAIDRIVGDTAHRTATDFSKIIARFKFRIALSSADVREVIQHRLLEKNERGTEALKDFYQREKDSMRTIFSFQEGARNSYYRDEESFVYSYPFPAYQYDLLQEALAGLGEHNAFVGQHVSRGERSMLEIFQDGAKKLKDRELFAFAPFDILYEGIRSTLDTRLIMAINQAEHSLEDPLALRILQALLLVKYVKGFKATLENLRVLLSEGIDIDQNELTSRMRVSLVLLEREMYLRRNGNVYEYLTNEEKDAEDEIRQEKIEYGQLRRHLSDHLFGEIIKGNKLTYNENGQDYPFQKAIDDETPHGQGDLVIRLITPWHPDAGERQLILNRAMGRKELAIFFPIDDEFRRELEIYFKTDSWIRKNQGTTSRYARIVSDKRAENGLREQALRGTMRRLFAEDTFAVADREIDIRASNAAERINAAFQILVRDSYPNLRMIKEVYTQDSLSRILSQSAPQSLFADDDAAAAALNEAESELLAWIARRAASSQPVTLAAIKEEFSHGSYGWYEWAILSTVALLYIHQEITLRQSAETLEGDRLLTVLKQNRGHESVTIALAPKISRGDIVRLQRLHFKLFHVENSQKGSKECATEFRDKLRELIKKLSEALQAAPDFPFIRDLRTDLSWLESLSQKEWHYFLENKEYIPRLEELVENKIDPAIAFLKSPNVETWRKIDAWFEKNCDNLSEIGMPAAVEAIQAIRNTPDLYRTSNTRHAKDYFETLQQKLAQLIEAEHKATHAAINQTYESLTQISEWNTLSEEVRESIKLFFGTLEKDATTKTSLGAIRDIATTKAKKVYEESLARILQETSKKNRGSAIAFATSEERKVPYQKTILETAADVDSYARSLAEHWKRLIAQGKKIRIE